MKTREDILNILRRQLPYLREAYGVRKLGLFGSYSRQEQKAESDIDLLVEFGKPIGFFKFIELESYLSEQLGAKAELVTEDALKPLIKPTVARDLVYA